jgi:hypothetical protein
VSRGAASRRASPRDTFRSAALAAAAARLSYAALTARPPGGSKTWTRVNHRGEAVTLLAGPAVTAGAIAGALASGLRPRWRVAMVVAGTGAAAFGSYDDLAGDGASRGFRGHVGALRRGQLTTGAVKLAGIGATGLAAALLADRKQPADLAIDAALVAGGANLINLFDLRPGRAIKAALAAGLLLSAPPGCSAPLAASAALLPEDLGEQAMLGDAGANAIGAMLGVAATTLPRRARLAALAGVIGLTAASEVVSFTKVIERTPALRWIDMMGRRPAGSAPRPEAAEPAAGETPGTPAEPARGAQDRQGTPQTPMAGTRPSAGPPPGRPGTITGRR